MIVDGKKLAGEILAGLKKEIAKLPRRLSVGAVLVGENAASESFLKQKDKVAEILEVNFKIFRFKSGIAISKLIKEVSKLNRNKNVNGIIIQLPLPGHIDTDLILNVINPKKDIDALSKNPEVLAPTVEAVKFIFQKYKINYKDKNILIVGKGRLVGQPIYNWLVSQAPYRKVMIPRKIRKIIIIDIKQKNQLPKLAREADIIISGVGKAGLINGNMIRKGLPAGRHGAVLIDFGFSQKDGPPGSGEARKISGDFDFESCAKKAKLITPVPGGMGPIMVAMLFSNLIKLNKNPT
ncbi:MAG: bifunctional 5,10-methylenetetrahydrofolate dehydrogenase/5,10-methenyltetrahydrofolate cyclohydrolase [bacterium]|nr:bifunctional 5,10-methylenetetrahydrofolate dehydrogenase/5,10-methenyltetrahydrofolate cyclohydrolase [bacterium]